MRLRAVGSGFQSRNATAAVVVAAAGLRAPGSLDLGAAAILHVSVLFYSIL